MRCWDLNWSRLLEKPFFQLSCVGISSSSAGQQWGFLCYPDKEMPATSSQPGVVAEETSPSICLFREVDSFSGG